MSLCRARLTAGRSAFRHGTGSCIRHCSSSSHSHGR
jgi:hypothetical protein